jgi:malonyl-CoA/methylmalonyl-CoA synthetase
MAARTRWSFTSASLVTVARELPIVARARRAEGVAIVDDAGEHGYDALLERSAALAADLLDGRPDLDEARVAVLGRADAGFVVAQWAVWRAGGVHVPLAVSHPGGELAYALDRVGVSTVIVDNEHASRITDLARERGIRVLQVDAPPASRSVALPAVDPGRRSVIFFTSGTTGRPKGAVWTHRTVERQATMLEAAWGWSPDDTAWAILPLHHVHGAINVVVTALWAGATCRMPGGFDPDETWEAIADGRITVLMAVPTTYVRLIATWEAADAATQTRWSAAAQSLRLMVCGSAALPPSVLDRWEALTGHRLLERYGMTEIGMAISNPLAGDRIAGHVGWPLPGVEVRLVDESGSDVANREPGEILVRGQGLFLEYWDEPAITAQAFADGWFRTGDVAALDPGGYRILGRRDLDIIKTGGYKVSALEIEAAITALPWVEACAVIGLADDEWGQRVAAIVVPANPSEVVSAERLRGELRETLAPYKLPTRAVTAAALPRNVMGKVVKADLAAWFPGAADTATGIR